MGSAHEPCQRSPTDSGAVDRPPPGHSRASRDASGGRAAEIIASSPERQKLEMQVQLHRSAQQCNEALAISRHLAEAPQQSQEPATWMGLVRRELAELDERLSRQLLRLQSQTDRVMEVFVTSLEGKVAQVMSKQPLTEWRLAELGANIKGLQEQLEMQARRGDAADARLQRFTTLFQSELRKLHIEVPSPADKPSPTGLEGTDALKDAMLASLREDEAGAQPTISLQEKSRIDSKLRRMDGALEALSSSVASMASEHRTLKSELESTGKSLKDLQEQALQVEKERSDAAKCQDRGVQDRGVQEMYLSKAEEKVEQMLENATDSFMSLLTATNQHLDAAVAKQASLEEDLRRLATSGSELQGCSSSASESRGEVSLQESVTREVRDCISRGNFLQSDSLGAWEKRLRREHRLEAAALWEAIGELAEHIGAGGASFIQVAAQEASSTGINLPDRGAQLEGLEHQEAGQSQHPPHEAERS